ncbi:MAG: zinc ABC transporter ATP-binding protein AztA [Acidimicrobiales bacterium]
MAPAVSIADLCVHFGDRLALDRVSVEIAPGSSLAVIGPNGSGKSTLLSAIAGLVSPSSGTVRLDGPAPAYVLQSTAVDRSFPINVRDTVMMARYPERGLLGRIRRADHDAVERALDRVELTDVAKRSFHELSGGQRQRVLVAQGLAQERPVLLLDEPANALDPRSREIIQGVIAEESAAGTAVITTTHDLDDARRCDVVLLLNTEAVAVGPPAEALTEDSLSTAFGGHFIRVGDRLLLDDPHHHHHHEH